jgi:chemotaxis protein MotB
MNQQGPSLRPEKGGSSDDGAWLETYADTITLLMAFFVMMFSMSTLDAGKFKVLKKAISSEISKRPPAGKGPNKDSSFLPVVDVLQSVQTPQRVPPEERASASKTSAEDLKSQPVIAQLAESGQMQVEYSPDGLKMEFASKALFPSGNADVMESMGDVLEEVGRVLVEGGFTNIDIEGHTDDVPIKTARFPSNWELSASRATAVARALLALHPIDPEIVRPSGFGDTRPAIALDSEEAESIELSEVRARNRRVVIHAQY